MTDPVLSVADDHRRIARALIALARDSKAANPYLVHHLAGHVGDADDWDYLDTAPDVLDRLDPPTVSAEVLRTAFGRSVLPPNVAGVVGSAHLLSPLPVADRAVVRQLAALQFTGRRSVREEPNRAGWTLLWADVERAPLHFVLSGHDGRVTGVAAVPLPDGRTLVASSSVDETIRLWDPTTTRQVGPPIIGHAGGVFSLAAVSAADGRTLLLTSGADSKARLWDPVTRDQVGHEFTVERNPWKPTVHVLDIPGRRPVLAIPDGKVVGLWDLDSGQRVGKPLKGHTPAVSRVVSATLPDGRTWIITGCMDHYVRFWDWNGGDVRSVTRGLRQLRIKLIAPMPELAVVRDFSEVILFASEGGGVRQWKLPSAELIGGPGNNPGFVGLVVGLNRVTPPDGRPLIMVGGRAYEPLYFRQVGISLGRYGARAACAVPLDNTRTLLATTAAATHEEEADKVRLWNLSRFTADHVAQSRRTSSGRINDFVVLPWPEDRPVLVVASYGAVGQFDLESGALAGTTLPPRAECLAVVPTDAGRSVLVMAGKLDGEEQITRWDPTVGSQMGAPLAAGHEGEVTATAGFIQGDKSRLAAAIGNERGLIRLWDVMDGTELPPLEGHTGPVWAIAVVGIADMTVLISGGYDRALRLWGLLTEFHEGPVLGHHANVITSIVGMTWPDGRDPIVASTSSDHTVRLWNVVTCQELGDPLPSEVRRWVQLASIQAEDSSYLVVAGDGLVELWDPQTRRMLHRVSCSLATGSFRLRASGSTLVIGGSDGIAVMALGDQPGRLSSAAT